MCSYFGAHLSKERFDLLLRLCNRRITTSKELIDSLLSMRIDQVEPVANIKESVPGIIPINRLTNDPYYDYACPVSNHINTLGEQLRVRGKDVESWAIAYLNGKQIVAIHHPANDDHIPQTFTEVLIGIHYRSIPEITLFREKYLRPSIKKVLLSLPPIDRLLRKTSILLLKKLLHLDSVEPIARLPKPYVHPILVRNKQTGTVHMVLHHGQNLFLEELNEPLPFVLLDSEVWAYAIAGSESQQSGQEQLLVDGLYAIVDISPNKDSSVVYSNGLPVVKVTLEGSLLEGYASFWYDVQAQFAQMLQNEHPTTVNVFAALSGGLDSTASLINTLLQILEVINSKAQIHVYPVYIDYGNRPKLAEIKSVEQTLNNLRNLFGQRITIPEKPYTLTLSEIFKGLDTVLLTGQKDYTTDQDASGTVAYVPNRNSIILNIIAAFAEKLLLADNQQITNTFNVLVLGANLTDGMTYKDNSPVFVHNINRQLNSALQRGIYVYTPFVNHTKTQFVRDLLNHSDNSNTRLQLIKTLQDTVSCRLAYVDDTGTIRTCITDYREGIKRLEEFCGPCANRFVAFMENGIEPKQ